MTTYTVEQGDSLSKIADRFKVPLERIWDAPENKDLRELRKTPDILYPGDKVFIPERKLKKFKRPTGQYHQFIIRKPKVELKLRLMLNGQPLADTECELPEAIEETEQITDKDGKVTFVVKPDLDQAKLTVQIAPDNPNHRSADDQREEPHILNLQIGHLDPVDKRTGLKSRLTSLGFHNLPINRKKDKHTPYVVHRFQKAFIKTYAPKEEFNQTVDTTGDQDDPQTLSTLEKQYEKDQSWAQTLTDEDKISRSEKLSDLPVAPNQWNTINLINGPIVTIDGHMHINSGHCCPMPLTWNSVHQTMSIIRPSREKLDDFAGKGTKILKNALAYIHKRLRQPLVVFCKVQNKQIELLEQAASRLVVIVAETLITMGYVQTALSKGVNTAAARSASALVKEMGAQLDRNANFFNEVGQIHRSIGQKLRDLGEYDPELSAQIAEQTTAIATRMVSTVLNIIDKTSDGAAELSDLSARQAELVAETQKLLADACRSAADDMIDLSQDINLQMDLVTEHASSLVRYVAEQFVGIIGVSAKVSKIMVKAITFLPTKIDNYIQEKKDWGANLHGFFSVSTKDTYDIGKEAVALNRAGCEQLPIPKDSDHLRIMMNMPMDMDFAHIDGYIGKQIYEKVKTRHLRLITLPPVYWSNPKTPISIRVPLPPNADPEAPKYKGETIEEKIGPFYYYFKRYGKMGKEKDLIWLADDEYHNFKDYPDQVEGTISAVAEHPWELLSMFHYDPRRWNKDTKHIPVPYKFHGKDYEEFPQAWDQPFKKYFSDDSTRLFMGMKLYTALGYRPMDDNLDYQADFYKTCIKKKLPIMCHCSPAGMPSYERPLYAIHDAQYDKDKLKQIEKQTKALMKERNVGRTWTDYARRLVGFPWVKPKKMPEKIDWRDYYHCEHFVSPRAWKKVMEQHSDLRLCLAHFGGDKPAAYTTWREKDDWNNDGDTWDLELIEMAKQYKHFYIDISYFLVKDYHKQFKRMITDPANRKLWDKIIFGTDWWMIGVSGISYSKFINEAKDALDEIDPDLWYRFSWINPMRFYRIYENKDAIAKGLEEVAGDITNEKRKEASKKAIKKYLKIVEKTELK